MTRLNKIVLCLFGAILLMLFVQLADKQIGLKGDRYIFGVLITLWVFFIMELKTTK